MRNNNTENMEAAGIEPAFNTPPDATTSGNGAKSGDLDGLGAATRRQEPDERSNVATRRKRRRRTAAERIAEHGFDPMRPDLADVYFALIANSNGWGVPLPMRLDGECRIYRGKNPRPDGYPYVTVNGHSIPVHRAAYAILNPDNPWPEHVHHTCERKSCVWSDHLRGMTAAEHLREHKARRLSAPAVIGGVR